MIMCTSMATDLGCLILSAPLPSFFWFTCSSRRVGRAEERRKEAGDLHKALWALQRERAALEDEMAQEAEAHGARLAENVRALTKRE